MLQRALHHLLSALIVAILLTLVSIPVFSLFWDAIGDQAGIILLIIVLPAAAAVGVVIGFLGSWLLLKRHNVPRGGEWTWWRGRPGWLQRILAIAVVAIVATFLSLLFLMGS